MDRRDFLKVSGSGLLFSLAPAVSFSEENKNKAINAWVRISPDGTVTIYSAGAEMGQGSMSSLPIIVAEEMDADWSKVKIEFAPADAERYGYMLNNSR
ncbi:MAG TPA: molybdopterin cofactor-binding domain-containing protein, partial [Rhizomicrobium sp.]